MPNMLGAYGPYFADRLLGDGPAALSLRTGRWRDVDSWRSEVRAVALARLAPPPLGEPAELRVDARTTFDGLDIEQLSWQLPHGPRTEAVLLKPAGATGPLPGVLGLHCHGGKKYLGWRKIALTDDEPWAVQREHLDHYYGGVGWANELARRGYVVLVHDTFLFGSRRVLVADVSDPVKYGGIDAEPDDAMGFAAYNSFAAQHEHIVAKSLLCAGTTWPGVVLAEDQAALGILAARPEVDPQRLGCGGLSGGGLRTVYLAGLDPRIRCAVCVGFMTTWRDFLLDKCHTHTWMAYCPILPRELDFPEVLGLRAPAATLVQSCTDDPLYTVPQMERADGMLRETFERAGAPEAYRTSFYPGGHQFSREMQGEAFGWFDEHLGAQVVG